MEHFDRVTKLLRDMRHTDGHLASLIVDMGFIPHCGNHMLDLERMRRDLALTMASIKQEQEPM